MDDKGGEMLGTKDKLWGRFKIPEKVGDDTDF